MPDDVTIYHVAAEAGVSISTVSLTLNRPERVKASTREHVLAVIDRLGFTPRAEAVSSTRKKLARVGVLAPFTAYDSYRRRLGGVLAESAGRQVDVVVFDHVSAARTVAPLLDSLPVTRRLDGILIMGLPLDDRLAWRLLERHLPTILVDSRRPEFSSITVDDEGGGYLVGRHLTERGYRTLALVGEHQRSTAYQSPGERRRLGVRKAATEVGIDADAIPFVQTTSDIAGGREAVTRLRAAGELPRAIVANHDLLAAGILLECRAQGIRVPEDVAVVGFDDGPLAEALDLTTVRQPLEASGRLGAKLLFEALTSPEQPNQQIVLDLRLVPRAST